MKHILLSLFIFGGSLASPGVVAQEKVFEYNGKFQTYIVPEGITSIEVELIGAGGGFGSWENARYPEKYKPGFGGKLTATWPVEPGDKIYIFVGGRGENATDTYQGKGGFNGGGDGNNTGTYGPYCGGGGGGASDLRMGGSSLGNRILVAGGGGGAGSNYPDGGDHGGHGGGLSALDGQAENATEHESCGRGGGQSNGGEGGQWPGYLKGEKGKLGIGGDGPDSTAGGGGGGGYYGGGAGSWSGGGGGSSYSESKATNVVHEQGVNWENGKVIIRLGCETVGIDVTGYTTMSFGDEITLKGKSENGSKFTWDNGIQNGKPFKPPLGTTTYTVTSSNQKECPNSIDIKVREGGILEAKISRDETYVTVSYRGAFEYKIENMNRETVITGHAENKDLVDISRLKPGAYRVSLIYKQIKQYVTFVKN